MAASSSVDPFCMVSFPTFDEDIKESENNSVQSGGLIGLLSNLFRPSSNNTRSKTPSNSNPIEQVDQEEKTTEDSDQKSSESITDIGAKENGNKADEQTLTTGTAAVNPNLFRYKMSEFRRYWMPDSSGNACYECNEKFNTFRRRHHCRLCGQIFCKSCANRQVNGTEFGYYGVLRLCNFCAQQMDIHLRQKRQRSEGGGKISVGTEKDLEPNNNGYIQNDSQKQFLLQPSSIELGFDHQLSLTKKDKSDGCFDSSSQKQATSINKDQEHLDGMFDDKIDKILDTLLFREQLNTEIWKPLLWELSRKVANKVTKLTLANTEAQSPLDFLHIKKLHMDVKPDFELINGVAFTKSLVHSSMPISMTNVSLMLLSGTISYERILEKFSSIEPLIQQERQYLRLQCDRILSAHVSLLVSENPVPMAAVELLMAEGISILANVKRSVLTRIAEATQTDVLNSLDAQFLQPRVGFVPDFSQRQILTSTGEEKLVIILENCKLGTFGPTILLKGRDIRELISAKRILRFLVLLRYSSSLEISFLSLFNSLPKEMATNNASGNSFSCHICELNRRNCPIEGDINGKQKDVNELPNEFMTAFGQVQLTNSPVIHFSPPYLETPFGSQCRLIPYFKLPLFRYLKTADCIKLREWNQKKIAKFEELEREEQQKREENARKGHQLVDPKAANEPQKLLNGRAWINFRSTSALYFRRKAELNRRAREEKLVKLNDILMDSDKEAQLKSLAQADVLNPYNHQGIAFLFCANSRKAQNTKEFCMGPYVLNKTFYDKDKDTSLGKFLLNYCFNAEYKCKGCDRPMQDHFRRIVHRNSRLEIATYNVVGNNRNSTPILGPFGAGASINVGGTSSADNEFNSGGILPMEELPSAIPNNNCNEMICWLRCNSCSANSSIVQMPDAVFHLSFAKFVDYLTNGSHWVSPFPSSIDLHQCLHCTFHSHSHFFALGNFVTSFRVSPVYPLNVLFSPIPCAIETSTKEKQTDEATNEEERKGEKYPIRDILDTKGACVVDIGSIIANALASEEYEEKKAKLVEEAKNNPVLIQPDFIETSHSDEKIQYTVKVHFAHQFQQFRTLIYDDGEKSYIQSLAKSSPWYPQGGKSGATFFRTDNERFVLKTLSRFELDSLKNCSQKYIDYVSMAVLERKLTALCKIFGAYGINYTNKQTGQTLKNDYLIMEYIFYKKDIKQIWDLKGSLRNRFASAKPNLNSMASDSPSSSVLLDENYIQDLWRNQMYLTSHSKAALSQAIINDSNFLANQGIMDYSLLAGISRGEEDEVIIGIVDYMRTFTLDKKVESLVKTALPISNSPTVISPEQYCKRFYERIDGYFAVAPDQWTSESPFTS